MSKKKIIFVKNQGFTFVELLLVMAVVVILSAAVIVSVASQKKTANRGRMMAELASAIQPMMMCKSDSGTISVPSSGGNICSLSANYGTWPSLVGTDFSTNGYSAPAQGSMNDGNWYFSISDNTGGSSDGVKICCNKTMNKCKEITPTDTCSATLPAF